MVQISQTRVYSTRRKALPVTKRCAYCGKRYKGSPQSNYCSKYHMECASRVRKSALIEALADLFVKYSEELTLAKFGTAFQITYAQALSRAGLYIKKHYNTAKYWLMALGYVYSERDRRWHLQAQLPPPLIH